MSEITYKSLSYEEINAHLMDGFVRHQVIDKVLRNKNGVLVEENDHWIEDWDEEKLSQINKNVSDIVKKGGVLIVAYDDTQLVGFACLVNELFFDEYMNLDLIHVSYDYRGLGIGKNLFHLIENQARNLGAKKLYISAHPSVESQSFYQSVGCVLAKKIHKGLFEHEPLDIQLEKEL